MSRACKDAGECQHGSLEVHLFHQRGRTRSGKCNVPTTRIDLRGLVAGAVLALIFGAAALA
jgi:hypothetical protein